ncbi:MAG: DUF308 domain-containing protein [Ruminococcus sp.]|nr:DUF308 domain-containing protein [Ruminococcus sp.]
MKEMLSNYVLGSLLCLVMGIALIIEPHILTEVVGVAIGVILIVIAAIGLIRFFVSFSKEKDERTVGILSLLESILILAAGIYVLIDTSLIEKIVMLVLGFYLACAGLPKIFDSIKIKRMGSPNWIVPLVTSVVTVVLGIVMIVIPVKTTEAIMRIVGIVLAVSGAVCFVSGFTATSTFKKLEKELEFSGGKGRDPRDTHKEDKENAVDID